MTASPPDAARAPQHLDGRRLARWLLAAAAAMHGSRDELDRINVFPVADGDTGTNLALTTAAVAAAVSRYGADPAAGRAAGAAADPDVGAVADVAARAAVDGAHGNSGGILAAWLEGFAASARRLRVLDGATLAAALRSAAASAQRAVGAPLEGTILTVARRAAEAASRVPEGSAVAAVAAAAGHAARAAVARTPDQLPVLRAAGVVDAGGRGLLVLLDVLAGVPAAVAARRGPVPAAAPLGADAAPPAFEVQYVLDADPAALPALRAALVAVGDSVVVAGRPGRYRVHVHTDDVPAALRYGRAAGTPAAVSVTALRAGAVPDPPAGGRELLVLTTEPGFAGLLARHAGTAAVVAGPEDVRAAVRAVRGRAVDLLPADAGAASAARAVRVAASAGARSSWVAPTGSLLQALAALAVRDPAAAAEDDRERMAAAAEGVREGAVAAAEPDPGGAAGRLLDRLAPTGAGLVTVVVGATAPPDLLPAVRARLRRTAPGVEVDVHVAAHADPVLLVGLE